MGPNAYSSRFTDPDENPCLDESNLVRKCLENNFYENSKCQNYFDNYKECKKFWGAVYKNRIKAGISPRIPTKKERELIMKQREKNIHTFAAKE